MYIQRYAIAINNKDRYAHNDCTINALSGALGVKYDLAKKILQQVVPLPHGTGQFLVRSNPRTIDEFSLASNYHAIVGLFANEVVNPPIPAVVGLTQDPGENQEGARQRVIAYKKNFADFVKEAEGTHILVSNGHTALAHEGHLIDGWDSSDEELLSSYRIYDFRVKKFLEDVADKMNINIDDYRQVPLDKFIELVKLR